MSQAQALYDLFAPLLFEGVPALPPMDKDITPFVDAVILQAKRLDFDYSLNPGKPSPERDETVEIYELTHSLNTLWWAVFKKIVGEPMYEKIRSGSTYDQIDEHTVEIFPDLVKILDSVAGTTVGTQMCKY